MRRSGENIRVDTPTRSIVSSDPYAFSRNPLYLSVTFAYVAVTLILNTAWPLFLFPIMLTAVQFSVTLREERYLERLLCDSYRGYQSQVRR